ncbi:RNA methyltransferase [Persicitalea jodogahamensis]|uniref:tRNA/rRNA methyltransferase n=1 Tax=Persicitalea jodogahamensis TaxID=402147 RepID=A0A8J3D1H0_9BACT|nr:RNA methyltransferase [Persicitalea jodogahamensis]GHB56601.1 tRNA/rRNA methyltransferase [Persicitalea jodogahamensis]
MKKRTIEEMNRLSVAEYEKSEKFPYVIILENIRSLNNVGSFFRTADAFRAEKIYLGGYTPTPPHREITKSALGAELAVAWENVPDTLESINRLKSEGYRIIAVEQAHNSVPLQDFTPIKEEKHAFVFGNEVAGVSEEAMALVDLCVEIPQFGTKHSFNVAVSAGIVLWKFVENNLT